MSAKQLKRAEKQPECATCVYQDRAVVFAGLACWVLVADRQCPPSKDGRVRTNHQQFQLPRSSLDAAALETMMVGGWDEVKITKTFIRHQAKGSGATSISAEVVVSAIRNFRPKNIKKK